MTQLTIIPRSFPEPRRRPVPTTCPFTVGQTVRNTRLNVWGQVLEQRHNPLKPGEWWIRVHTGYALPTCWLASLCEVA